MDGFRAKLDYLLKHNKVINKSFRIFASAGVRVIGLITPMDNKAVIFSAHSRKYNDSPRAIYEYMITQPEYKDFTFYWALDNTEVEIPGNAIKIVPDTFRYFKTALKCKYWITCVNIERSLKFKKKKCVYLNTWHGIPIKTVGNEAAGRKDYDFSYIDFFCVSGEYEVPIYEKSFNIPKSHIIRSGMPRNDVLYSVSSEKIMDIKKRLDLPSNKKIILYAPTWRDSKDGGKSYSIKPPMDLKKWEEELGKDYVLLFRTHPYTNQLLGVDYNDFVRDYSDYPSINDLMMISDILVSDYSATIFDFSILERPIISFAYDCDEYGKERGFAMDIRKEMPGGICESEEEVINRIKSINNEQEICAVKHFKEKYLAYGGHATEECLKALFHKEGVNR